MNDKSESYIFIFLLSAYLVFHFLQMNGIGLEWIRFYAKDLIIAPILLMGANRVQLLIHQKIEIGKKEIITLVIYLSLVFEWILPLLKPQLKTDLWDVVMYSLGAVAYGLSHKKNAKQKRLNKSYI